MKPSSRTVLGVLVALAALLAGVSCVAAPPRRAVETARPVAAEARFTILQINDVYKIEGLRGGTIGGLARVRTLRKQLEAEGRPVFVLHAGDLLFPSVMSKYLRAQPMIRALNLLDGDPAAFDPGLIVVFGNHEFDDRDPGVLLGRVAQSDFEWLSSNVGYRSAPTAAGEPLSRRLANVHDTLVKEVGGARVGLFGITTDAQPRDYVAYEYQEPGRRAAIERALGRLRAERAGAVIALTHQDLDQDERLARDFPEVDLVVGGHEHFFLERRVGGTPITKADADAKTAVVHDVRVRPDGSIADEYRKVDLDASVEKDPAVEEEVAKSLAELATAVRAQTGRDLTEVIGETENLLEGTEPAVRGRETALGNFLADVIRDRTASDVAFVNGGAIRINDDIPPGPVRNYDLEGVFYFDNKVVAFEITGAELLDLLRTSVSKVHTGHGRFLQVSGIRFRYRVSGTADEPTYAIEASDVEVASSVASSGAVAYRPLELSRKYSAGSLDYLWENGYRDGYELFAKGRGGTSPARRDAPPLGWRSITEEAIRALPDRRIRTKVEERIVRDAGERPAASAAVRVSRQGACTPPPCGTENDVSHGPDPGAIFHARLPVVRQHGGVRDRARGGSRVGDHRTDLPVLGGLAARHQHRDDDRDVPDGVPDPAGPEQGVARPPAQAERGRRVAPGREQPSRRRGRFVRGGVAEAPRALLEAHR